MTNKLKQLKKEMEEAMAFAILMSAPLIGICIAHYLIINFNTDIKNAEAACNAAKEAYNNELNKNNKNNES